MITVNTMCWYNHGVTESRIWAVVWPVVTAAFHHCVCFITALTQSLYYDFANLCVGCVRFSMRELVNLTFHQNKKECNQVFLWSLTRSMRQM